MNQSTMLYPALFALASKERAVSSSRFFKTGPGEYGHGDKFMGVTVPVQRKVARKFRDLPLPSVLPSLKSPWHEERLTALFILIDMFERAADDTGRQTVVDAYLKHLPWVNNWDLVDASARQILGAAVRQGDRSILYSLAASKILWERRVSIVATHEFIFNGESAETLKISALLLKDKEDLMHKAVGWMLRELGKRVSMDDLRGFLSKHAGAMPRTMLRYAIEHMTEDERKMWMGRA